MIFNSLEFGIFLPIAFVLFWTVNHFIPRFQNHVLVVLSFFFYGWWDYRFLGLIALSIFIDFFAARAIHLNFLSSKRIWLILSIAFNLSLLAGFKYFNFFSQSFRDAFQFLGYHFDFVTLSVILPVGISFYTFQTMSYSIDVYNGKTPPVNSIWNFAAYVSFFPQLVAGPIERANVFLPQFLEKKAFDFQRAKEGLKLIIWGLFKKMVIADQSAVIVNRVFNGYQSFNSSSIVLAVFLFAIQIYCDFSGYTDVARGSAKLFGFELSLNFRMPYFSRTIGEFWRRWHISLSNWFRDYVYIPLGGSRKGIAKSIFNVFVVFVLSGFWHGSNWTFIAWGAFHAVLFIPSFLTKRHRAYLTDDRISFSQLPRIVLTFVLVCIGWVFFRAQSMSEAIDIFHSIISNEVFQIPQIRPFYLLIGVMFLFSIEWSARNSDYALAKVDALNSKLIRWTFYSFLIIGTVAFAGSSEDFIYFQF